MLPNTLLRRSGAVFAVAVMTACGGGAGGASSAGTSISSPVLTGLSPASGLAGAATPVTVTGSGFQDGAAVRFDASAATNVVVQSATTLTATAPALPAGAVNVVVTNPGGEASAPATFTYMPPGSPPAPTIASMTPATDLASGGKAFTITGTSFSAGATVTIGGAAAVAPVAVSSSGTSITGTIPAGAVGPAPVVVRNADGQTASRSDLFAYAGAAGGPVISSLSVDGAPPAGGTSIFIAGTGISPSAAVTFGGASTTSVPQNPASGYALGVTVPPTAPGTDTFVELRVTNPDGTFGIFTSAKGNGFHYGPPPAITGVTPAATITCAGGLPCITPGTSITVAGANFTASAAGPRAGLQVSVGGVVVPLTASSPTQIVFDAPKLNNVSVPVTVTNFDKQSATSTDRLLFAP
jgi:hypothetical protein